MSVNVRIEVSVVVCQSCEEPHHAIKLAIEDDELVMPAGEAKRLADTLYSAIMSLEDNFQK